MCSMSFQHRIRKSTTRAIIKETCESLWITLMHNVLKMPSKQRWEEIERDFNRMWQVPNCVGAIDGKHVIIQVVNFQKTNCGFCWNCGEQYKGMCLPPQFDGRNFIN